MSDWVSPALYKAATLARVIPFRSLWGVLVVVLIPNFLALATTDILVLFRASPIWENVAPCEAIFRIISNSFGTHSWATHFFPRLNGRLDVIGNSARLF